MNHYLLVSISCIVVLAAFESMAAPSVFQRKHVEAVPRVHFEIGRERFMPQWRGNGRRVYCPERRRWVRYYAPRRYYTRQHFSHYYVPRRGLTIRFD